MQILDLSRLEKQEVVCKAVAVLKAGGLVVFPTETTYGLGVDATNQEAVNRLLQYKRRREGKPLSVAVADTQMAEEYVELNDTARNVHQQFLPGPVTVVSKGKHKVAQGVESELGTLGIRIPAYPLVVDIVKELGRPITATGANASYKKRPYTIQDIFDNTSARQQKLIELILDAGELPHNEPSTVIDTTAEDLRVLRQGTIVFRDSDERSSNSEDETIRLGKVFIQKYKNMLSYKSIIVCLEGELGAGKTQFVKGIAQGLGIHRSVSSPTYTLLRNYDFELESRLLEFVHIDVWRLLDPQELLQLGMDDYVENGCVIAVEWADKVQEIIERYKDESKVVWIKIVYGETENRRKLYYTDQPFSLEKNV